MLNKIIAIHLLALALLALGHGQAVPALALAMGFWVFVR